MNLTKQQIRDELWRRSELSWLLDVNQQQMVKSFYESGHRILTWLLARRSGKTYCLCVLALEQCLRKPNSIVKLLCPTKTMLNSITRPLLRQILETCPETIKPEFKKAEYIYYFPNGSELQLAGADNGHAEKLRGGSSDLSIIDEAGDVDNLDYIIKSILLPTTLTTKGKIVISGTPPKESEHDFLKFIEEAEFKGSLVKKTIYDNPRLKPEDIEDLIVELGGKNSDAFRRECLVEIIKDSTTSVLPEFTEALEKEIVKEWPRPPHFDSYTAMDLGYNDLTAVLFMYYDFRGGKVVVEDELVLDFTQAENNLTKLASDIKGKEDKLWFNVLTNEVKKPYLRVSDINPIVTSELYKTSNKELHFIAPSKEDNEAMVHNLRVMLQSKKIIINPKCTNLIRHLRNVKWQGKAKKTFARSAENGHYDLVDALKYGIRTIVFSKNPYPAGFESNLRDCYGIIPMKQDQDSQIDVFKKLFRRN